MPHPPMQRILIVNDSLDGLGGALDRAARLAAPGQAAVRVIVTPFDAVAAEPPGVLPPSQRDELIAGREQQTRRALSRLLSGRGRPLPPTGDVVWTRTPLEEITAAANAWPADLLIKPASEHHPVADHVHTPLDWALMREAVCPLLVCKGAVWSEPATVLAAMDAGDAAHAGLNRSILLRAGQLADRLGAALHVVSTYPDLGQTVDELQVAMDFDGIKQDMREHRRAVLAGLVEAADAPAAELHVLEGRPETVIPQLARELGASITVLGTAARHGLGKLILGNTAETLISRLPGDIATVRVPWS